MSEWQFLDYASRDNLFAVMNREADDFLALVSDPDTWTNPTASGHWQVRDLAGHLIDTIEGYLPGFEAARGRGSAGEPRGLTVMHEQVDRGALATRILVRPDGVTVEPGEVDDLPAVLEFDPASFVLTAFGRINAGCVHGDTAHAHRFLNAIFRV
jgi:Mycothiol maleylpyruvate isomerase N-terminal domain.